MACNSGSLTLEETERLVIVKPFIEDYKTKFPYGSRWLMVKRLVEDFKRSGMEARVVGLRKKQFEMVQNLITDYSGRDIFKKATQYDLFRALKLQLSENEISNITADVLNPAISPFGKSILLSLLINTDKKEVADIIQQTKARDIKVKREVSGDNSRIDIRIFTNNSISKNCTIDIELKVHGGSETVKEGKPQTEREWKDLLKFTDSYNISEDNIAAYFVSPSGAYAKDNNFIPLATEELHDYICEVLEDKDQHITSNSKFTDDTIGALRHFFQSRWLH